MQLSKAPFEDAAEAWLLQMDRFRKFKNLANLSDKIWNNYFLSKRLKKFKNTYSYKAAEILDLLTERNIIDEKNLDCFIEVFEYFRDSLKREVSNINSKFERKFQESDKKAEELKARILELEKSLSSLCEEGTHSSNET